MRISKKVWVGIVVLVFLGGAAFIFSSRKAKTEVSVKEAQVDYYYCPMHPWIHLEKPGTCAICGMTLLPWLKNESAGKVFALNSGAKAEKKIEYWADAMNPSFHSDKPGKAADGMDLVPVYEEMASLDQSSGMPDSISGLIPITLTSWRQQLIGIKLANAEERPIVQRIVTVGRFAGGSNDFATMASDFNTKGKTGKSRNRYLVADVYELDIPLVKKGQKAWVSSFSGSGEKIEGLVSYVYPNDGTQSRAGQVQIKLNAPMPGELFANVEIQAITTPRLSVPSDSVLDSGLHAYVYVQKEAGHFTAQAVTVGFKGEDYWEITAGLKIGDQVVRGANFLVDADAKLEASFANPEGVK